MGTKEFYAFRVLTKTVVLDAPKFCFPLFGGHVTGALVAHLAHLVTSASAGSTSTSATTPSSNATRSSYEPAERSAQARHSGVAPVHQPGAESHQTDGDCAEVEARHEAAGSVVEPIVDLGDTEARLERHPVATVWTMPNSQR